MSLCCINCFNNDFLLTLIKSKSTQTGQCNFCGAIGQPLLPAEMLALYFQPVFQLYQEKPGRGSKSIGVCFSEHWKIFSKNINTTQKEALTDAILLSNFSGKKFYFKKIESRKQAQEKWNFFSDNLKNVNRFRVDPEFENVLNGIRIILRSLQKEIPTKTLFRARINKCKTAYCSNEMLMPPSDKVLNGRANPPGIPYLYTATTANTAIHEVRPHVNAAVSVAKLYVKPVKNAKIVDLRFLHPQLSPFEIDTEEDLEVMTANLSFIEILGRELSKPISPDLVHLEYLPSQYLCEFIKNEGYVGIAFKSSILPRSKDGFNIVLFNENLIDKTKTTVNVYNVTSHRIRSSLIK